MTKVNIREALNQMDKDTDCKYDLVTLYESCNLTEEDKKDIAKSIADKEDADVIYDKLVDKYGDDLSFDDDNINDLKFLDMSKEAYPYGEENYDFEDLESGDNSDVEESFSDDLIDSQYLDDTSDGHWSWDYDDDELANIYGGDTRYDYHPDGIEESQNTDLHEGNSIADSKEIKTDPKKYVKAFLKDFNIPKENVRIKKGPYETYAYRIPDDCFGLYITLDDNTVALQNHGLDSVKEKYQIDSYETVTTRYFGDRIADQKLLVNIKEASGQQIDESKSINESTEVIYQKGNKKIVKDGYGYAIDDGINANRFYVTDDGKPKFDDGCSSKFWLDKVNSLIKAGKLTSRKNESKSIKEDINDSDEVLTFKRDVHLANDADEIQLLIYELSDGVAEDTAQQAFNENESNDLETLKSAVITAIDVYLEDNEWLGESKSIKESKYTSSLIGPDNLLMNAEEAYFDDNLGDFVADSLNDGSATEEELLAVTEKSSFIEYDDMLNAIDYAKSLNESFDISWNGNKIATSANKNLCESIVKRALKASSTPDLIIESAGKNVTNKFIRSLVESQSVQEATSDGGHFTVNFGHWINSKSFQNKQSLLKFLRSHIISSSSVITLAKNVTDDYENSIWYDTAENVQKFNLTDEQRHEIFEKGYTLIDSGVEEQMNPIDESQSIREGTSLKRVARYNEFDNGHVMHNWEKISSDEAEERAKKASIEDPDDIYYVAYDDIMEPSSDLRWINGKSYNYDEVQIRGGKPYIKNASATESIENTPIEDIDDFVSEVKQRFPGSEAIYDGDTNTIKITLDNVQKESLTEEDSESDELETADQKISSANTSINSSKLPAIFRLVKFEPDTLNLDYGGGKFDNAAEYLAQQNVTNLVYDPYNRSTQHNAEVLQKVRENGGADTVTISNVLNVIAEPEARLTVLRNAKKLVKPGGNVYITVYEGNKSGEGTETKSGYQLNKGTADYIDEISSVFSTVNRKGKLIIAK